MKAFKISIFLLFIILACTSESGCEETRVPNKTALNEQSHTENNQSRLLENQPLPNITWSLERDNLIKRFKLQNDRSVMFYMYIFNEGVQDPIGYYQINKVSSVNSQLSNTMQIISGNSTSNSLPSTVALTIPSPAEDGSYGTNGDAVFGFTPEEIYIEHNMHYICATVPLTFKNPVNRLAIVNVETEQKLKEMMERIKAQK